MQTRIPPVRYVNLFPGRTGSTYLTSHMNSHPQIVARYEILVKCPDSWEAQLDCLNELFDKKRFPLIRAVGFKSKLNQILDRKAFQSYIIERNFKVIHQIRTNHLKHIVSVIRARTLRSEQGTSNLLDPAHTPMGPTEIPEPIFACEKKRLDIADQLDRFVESLELPKLTIVYEDMLKDEKREFKRLWDFLGVDHVPTEGLTRKNTPDDIRKAVTNLDEILEHHPEMQKFVD